MMKRFFLLAAATASTASAFMFGGHNNNNNMMCISKINDIRYTSSQLQMVDDTKDKLAKMVSGEELETMLQEWDQPLVVDAYATWYVNQNDIICSLKYLCCTYLSDPHRPCNDYTIPW